MQEKQLICINCPLGCPLTVTLDKADTILTVSGNTCPRGKNYATKELTAPTRIVTTVVSVSGSKAGATTVSCKTKTDIPKEKIFEIVQELKSLCIPAPITIGDILKANVADTGVDIIATKNIL
ncbi:MAG: DUF1667 domain-containing protein [Faecalibacterium sp.]